MDGYHFCGAAHNTRSGVTGGAAPEGETIMSVAAVPEKRENSRQFGIEPGNPEIECRTDRSRSRGSTGGFVVLPPQPGSHADTAKGPGFPRCPSSVRSAKAVPSAL